MEEKIIELLKSTKRDGIEDLIDFLKNHRSTVIMNNTKTKDYVRKYNIIDPIAPE